MIVCSYHRVLPKVWFIVAILTEIQMICVEVHCSPICRCESGFGRNTSCIASLPCDPCPAGTYNDGSSDVCQVCSSCPKGYYAAQKCTSSKNIKCELCGPNTFTDRENSARYCKPCSRCSRNHRTSRECSVDRNTECKGCLDGFFFQDQQHLCMPCSRCYSDGSSHTLEIAECGTTKNTAARCYPSKPDRLMNAAPTTGITSSTTHRAVTKPDTKPMEYIDSIDEDVIILVVGGILLILTIIVVLVCNLPRRRRKTEDEQKSTLHTLRFKICNICLFWRLWLKDKPFVSPEESVISSPISGQETPSLSAEPPTESGYTSKPELVRNSTDSTDSVMSAENRNSGTFSATNESTDRASTQPNSTPRLCFVSDELSENSTHQVSADVTARNDGHKEHTRISSVVHEDAVGRNCQTLSDKSNTVSYMTSSFDDSIEPISDGSRSILVDNEVTGSPTTVHRESRDCKTIHTTTGREFTKKMKETFKRSISETASSHYTTGKIV